MIVFTDTARDISHQLKEFDEKKNKEHDVFCQITILQVIIWQK